MSVVPERINGFSVNMTVSLDLHRYEDEVSEEKLHDDSSLLSAQSDNQNLIAFTIFAGWPTSCRFCLPSLLDEKLLNTSGFCIIHEAAGGGQIPSDMPFVL